MTSYREMIKLSSVVCRPVSVCKEFLPKILPKKIRPNQWAFSSCPHNTNTQDEPLPPYPQRLRPPSPWKHPPWTRIVAPQLPMSLLQWRDKEGSGGATTNAELAAAREKRLNCRLSGVCLVSVCPSVRNSYLRSYLRKSAQTSGLSPAAPTTQTHKMSRYHPTPSGFALPLHGNIRDGPESFRRGSL